MVPCDSCEKDVATSAKTCPHCGEVRKTAAGYVLSVCAFTLVISFYAAADMGVNPLGLLIGLQGLFPFATMWGCLIVGYFSFKRWMKFV